mmetsp:Transcript_7740/g.18717  ORF Transcript_7740/g.18717 Transcript_7740/m.18717 type:complete len:221 (-) Transcript_7740:896-1558(-)
MNFWRPPPGGRLAISTPSCCCSPLKTVFPSHQMFWISTPCSRISRRSLGIVSAANREDMDAADPPDMTENSFPASLKSSKSASPDSPFFCRGLYWTGCTSYNSFSNCLRTFCSADSRASSTGISSSDFLKCFFVSRSTSIHSKPCSLVSGSSRSLPITRCVGRCACLCVYRFFNRTNSSADVSSSPYRIASPAQCFKAFLRPSTFPETPDCESSLSIFQK